VLIVVHATPAPSSADLHCPSLHHACRRLLRARRPPSTVSKEPESAIALAPSRDGGAARPRTKGESRPSRSPCRRRAPPARHDERSRSPCRRRAPHARLDERRTDASGDSLGVKEAGARRAEVTSACVFVVTSCLADSPLGTGGRSATALFHLLRDRGSSVATTCRPSSLPRPPRTPH